MVRVNPLLDAAPGALTVIAVVGAATAFFAATAAVAQRDIKKVLAYSTVSQLGYMFLAVGLGAYVAAIFHMITHAFFKALLFLGAGSVIHGLHDEQDMRRMGGLRKLMPVTAGTFIVGWLAIAGIPPFSGFWSKDEILAAAWDSNRVLWLVGVVTALLTAYYMSRQVFLVFFGPPRWQEAHAGASPEEALAAPEHEPAATEAAPATPHESPPTMTVPLVVLAGLAAVGGLLNLPGVLTLEHFLEPVFEDRLHELSIPAGVLLTLGAVTVVGAVIGILAARAIYLRGTQPADRYEPELLRRAWGFDQALAGFFGGPGRAFANFTARVLDGRGIDGAVNGVATLVRGSGSRLRLTQTGYVRNYALFMGGGAVLLLAFFLLRTGLA
jgi:NADH-quinone oxidoreductase subunit L